MFTYIVLLRDFQQPFCSDFKAIFRCF